MKLLEALRTFFEFLGRIFRRVPAPSPLPVPPPAPVVVPAPAPVPAPGPVGTGRGRMVGAVLAGSIAIVAAWEGLYVKPYRDIVGVKTVCYGETDHVEDRTYTVAECKNLLATRLPQYAAGVEKCSDLEQAPDKVYIAVVSWAYNVGVGAACKSTLVKRINAHNWRAACNELPKWNKAGGKVVKGLVNRRADEQKLCLEGT